MQSLRSYQGKGTSRREKQCSGPVPEDSKQRMKADLVLRRSAVVLLKA